MLLIVIPAVWILLLIVVVAVCMAARSADLARTSSPLRSSVMLSLPLGAEVKATRGTQAVGGEQLVGAGAFESLLR